MRRILFLLVWLLFFTPAQAGGPVYLPVIWSRGMAFPTTGLLSMPVLSGDPAIGYTGVTYGPDTEAYVTIDNFGIDDETASVVCRADIGLSVGYAVSITTGLGGQILLQSDGGATTLGTYAPAIVQAGDSVGIKCSGSNIAAWYKPVGGNWSQVIGVFDGSHTGAGYLALIAYNASLEFSGFGGGTAGSAEPMPSNPTPTYSQCDPDPILRVTNGTDVIDLLGNNSGWELEDPYWNPQIAQYKSGGSYVNSGLAEGQRLVHKEYDNVIETIHLSAHGINQDKTIQTIRRLLQIAKQASDYWTKSYEYDDVWLEVKPTGSNCLTGYARIIKMTIPEITNPYGQPFFSSFSGAILDGITLTIEREPLWRGLPPGQLLGPMYNLLKNPDFEFWNFGVVDSQPDSWADLETLQITGQNSRQSTAVNSGQYCLKIQVSGSTAAGKAKGVTQIAESTKNNTEYTIVAWVRSDGMSNGVGRILVTYSSQLELYRSSDRHGWTLYTGTFTTGVGDVVSVNLEILTTAANTDGTIYIDSLMLLEGDFEEAAANGTLPYMSSSHIVNHWDQPGGAAIEAGAINFVDVWNVPGDEDALVRLEILNESIVANLSAVVENIAELRIGQRRSRNVLNFQNYYDPSGGADATASSSDYISPAALSASWQDIGTNLISGAINTGDNQGRFRAYARIYDARAGSNPNLEARLRYFIGSAGVNEKILQPVSAPIRAGWCVVGLTPTTAIMRDYRQSPNPPGQLGYTIQFRRPAGTDTARLDYVLLLPTDGGFLTAIITPAVEPGTAIAVDNSGPVIQASATGLKRGYVAVWDAGVPTIAFAAAEFNGYTYVAGYDAGGPPDGRLFRRPSGQVGSWGQVATFTDVIRQQMDVYNGRLHLGTGAGTARVWSSVDGVAWSNIYNPTSESGVYGIKSFDGYLWTGGLTRIGRWNGATYTESYNFGAGGAAGIQLGVYKNQLYALKSDVAPQLYVRQTGDTWTLVGATPASAGSPIVFNGKLFMAAGRYIASYDGSTIVTEEDFGVGWTVYSFAIHDEKLYVAVSDGTLSYIYVSNDGSTWEIIYDPAGIGLANVYVLFSTQGRLDMAGTTVGGNIGMMTIVPDTVVQYDIADFQGGSFTAPPRRFADPRRHRWVFSYDRENYVNNVDDRALIGIGYVPRYLTLRGAN